MAVSHALQRGKEGQRQSSQPRRRRRRDCRQHVVHAIALMPEEGCDSNSGLTGSNLHSNSERQKGDSVSLLPVD